MRKELIPCIYGIRNIATGKIYVGKTKDIKMRISTHMSKLKHGNHHVEQMEYDHDHVGSEYEIYILCHLNANVPDAFKEEKFWFKFFNSTDERFGYNTNEQHRQFDFSKFERWSS